MPPIEKAKKIGLREPHGLDEVDGIVCHLLNRIRWCATGSSDTTIVERDHVMLRREAVHHSGWSIGDVRTSSHAAIDDFSDWMPSQTDLVSNRLLSSPSARNAHVGAVREQPVTGVDIRFKPREPVQ